MDVLGLACKTNRKFKATTDSRHNLPIAPNHLDRQFTVAKPNQTYVGDITYIHTQEGWQYSLFLLTYIRGKWSASQWLSICRPNTY